MKLRIYKDFYIIVIQLYSYNMLQEHSKYFI